MCVSVACLSIFHDTFEIPGAVGCLFLMCLMRFSGEKSGGRGELLGVGRASKNSLNLLFGCVVDWKTSVHSLCRAVLMSFGLVVTLSFSKRQAMLLEVNSCSSLNALCLSWSILPSISLTLP